jgi:hypothetical protein
VKTQSQSANDRLGTEGDAVKRFFFPFSALYEHLDLKQRWWHRLAVVLFSVGFVAVATIIVIVTLLRLPSASTDHERHQALLRSFPQLEPPEDSKAPFDFDYVQMPTRTLESNGFDSSKYPMRNALDCYDANGQLLVDESAAFEGVITSCGPGSTAKPKSERMNVPKARLRYVERAEACQKQVVAEYAKGDVELYRSKMNACIKPVADVREGSEETLQRFTDVTPIKQSFKQEMEANPQSRVVVEIPTVGTVAFPGGMQRKEVESVCGLIYKRAAAADRQVQALMIIYALALLTVAFYLPQIGYRLLLYVLFGERK